MNIFNIHSVINQALVEPLALSFSPFRVDCGTSLSHKTLFIHFHAHSQNMRKKRKTNIAVVRGKLLSESYCSCFLIFS